MEHGLLCDVGDLLKFHDYEHVKNMNGIVNLGNLEWSYHLDILPGRNLWRESFYLINSKYYNLCTNFLSSL